MHILVVYGSIVYRLFWAELPACALVVCLRDQTVDIIACSKKSGKNGTTLASSVGKLTTPSIKLPLSIYVQLVSFSFFLLSLPDDFVLVGILFSIYFVAIVWDCLATPLL